MAQRQPMMIRRIHETRSTRVDCPSALVDQQDHEDQDERQQHAVEHLRPENHLTSGNLGTSTTPAPTTISSV